VPNLLHERSSLSGGGNFTGRKIAKDAGADDFIAKPFDLDELVEKIEKYI